MTPEPTRARRAKARQRRWLGWLLIAICALLTVRSTSASDVFDGWEFYGADELYAWCGSADTADRRACESYVCGVLDAWAVQSSFKGVRKYPICLPTAVSCARLAELVVKRLRENPIERRAAAAGAVGYALYKLFPCQAK